MKLDFRSLYMPKSPVVSSSSRRACPCCEDCLNLADLDTPTPKTEAKKLAHTEFDKDNPGFVLVYRYYSSGTLHKVVRRRPYSPCKKEDTKQIAYTRSFFNKNIKKLTINQKSGFKNKSQNPVFKEKEAAAKNEEKSFFNKEDIEKLWNVQEKAAKKTGGLNKLQKVLRRSNLPPLATSVKNLRIRRQASFNFNNF